MNFCHMQWDKCARACHMQDANTIQSYAPWNNAYYSCVRMFHRILTYKKLACNASFCESTFTLKGAEENKTFCINQREKDKDSDPMQQGWRRR